MSTITTVFLNTFETTTKFFLVHMKSKKKNLNFSFDSGMLNNNQFRLWLSDIYGDYKSKVLVT